MVSEQELAELVRALRVAEPELGVKAIARRLGVAHLAGDLLLRALLHLDGLVLEVAAFVRRAVPGPAEALSCLLALGMPGALFRQSLYTRTVHGSPSRSS